MAVQPSLSFLFLQKHSNDVGMTALWLKNVYLLHDLLTQHSPKSVGPTLIIIYYYYLHNIIYVVFSDCI